MPATLDEVQKVVSDGFPDADVSGLEEENYRIIGPIVWKDFEGTEPPYNRTGPK